MNRNLTEVTVTGTRNMRYGEFLVVKASGVEIYNTTGLSDCPAQLWNALDVNELAKQFGALKVQLNGPQYWMMDSQTLWFGETVSFGGIEARWGATADPALLAKEAQGITPYTVFMPKKKQKMVYSKGKPVYELVDPDGNSYVLPGRKEQVPFESLATLGQRMKELPKGWRYRSRILTEDLVFDLGPDQTIYGIGDEFHQYYTRILKTE
jgi:hypothetical protein